jgi:hypothetical protein
MSGTVALHHKRSGQTVQVDADAALAGVVAAREQVIREVVDALRAAETPCNLDLYGPAARFIEETFLAAALNQPGPAEPDTRKEPADG